MKQLSKSEKINLSTTEIAKSIREQLKEEFPNCKFSITRQYFSMGSSITVCLMKSNFKVIRDFSELSKNAISNLGFGYTDEDIQQRQQENYHQLNPYTLREEYNPDLWCNGVFLTKEGHNLLKRVVGIVDYFNYDESDAMTDYSCVNFYSHLEIGKWNKPYENKSV